MSEKEVRIRPPWIALNQNKLTIQTDNIRRFFRLDFPVYRFPVDIKERSSEPYQEIEKNMVLLIDYTDIKNREELFQTMGIAKSRVLANHVLEYLLSINHIEEGETLKLTPLGRESLRLNSKVKEVSSARVLYFEALSLEPLPYYFYKSNGSKFLTPRNNGDLFFSNVIDVWDDFPYENIKEILKYDGEKRLERNLPQEMIEIDLNPKVKETYEQLGQGYVWYIPLYIVVMGSVSSFSKRPLSKLNFKVINAVNGQESDFFKKIIINNMQDTKVIFDPLFEDFNPLLDDSLKVWQDEKISSLNDDIKLGKDQNLFLNVSELMLDNWIENDNMKPLMDIAYDNIVTIDNDRLHRGRIMRLLTSKEIEEKAIKYIIEKKVEKLKKQDKSATYIKREKERLLNQIYDIRKANIKPTNSEKTIDNGDMVEKKINNEEILKKKDPIFDKLIPIGSLHFEESNKGIESKDKKSKKIEYHGNKKSFLKRPFTIIKLAVVLFILLYYLESSGVTSLSPIYNQVHVNIGKFTTAVMDMTRSTRNGIVVAQEDSLRVRTNPDLNSDFLQINGQYYRLKTGEVIEILETKILTDSIWYKIFISTNHYQGEAWVCGILNNNIYIELE
ncbi:MAG: SH3 domain-containing protein [Halanaerobiales bacterium]